MIKYPGCHPVRGMTARILTRTDCNDWNPSFTGFESFRGFGGAGHPAVLSGFCPTRLMLTSKAVINIINILNVNG